MIWCGFIAQPGKRESGSARIVCRHTHNWGQKRSWQERSKQSSAEHQKQGGTQDARVDSEQRAPILKSMMKISNKLKTAAKVFDVFLKENKSSLELESSTCGISSRSNALQWEKKSPRLVIPSRFVDIFKLSQTNCDFLIWQRTLTCNIVLIWAYY